jgi:hypothetical protein
LSEGVDEPRELVAHFYRLFHKTENASPGRKELEHARDLIEKYGYERARYVVEYGSREAPKTKFKPVVFGGIIQYAMPAVLEYDQKYNEGEEESSRRKCEYCSYSPGFRYVGVNNELRRCSHDPAIESKYKDFAGAKGASSEVEGVSEPQAIELWEKVLSTIGTILGKEPVETWLGGMAIRPMKIIGERKILLRTANAIVTDWVGENFYEVIKQALKKISGSDGEWEIEFETHTGNDFSLS